MADPDRRLYRGPVPPRGRAYRRRARPCSRTSSTRLRRHAATGRWPRSSTPRSRRIRAAGGPGPACSARSRAAWTPRWWPSLLHKAIGDQLTCLFVDNGLLRKGEAEAVVRDLPRRIQDEPDPCGRNQAIPRSSATASRIRRSSASAIGAEFIAVFEEEARKLGRHPVARPGHALSRRDRVGVVQGPVGHHQDAPQRGRPAAEHAVQAGRAAARALQGRGARAGRAARAAARDHLAPALPGARASPSACWAR